MAFLKFINETITYPYNTKTDYPYTGFPPGTDYPEFNVFWVYPVPQNPPENNSSTEGTPVFNAELSRWEQTWTYTPIAPSPDWTAFNTAMNLNAEFDAWYAALKASGSPGERAAIALITPSTMGSAEVFTLAYNTASAIVAPSASDKTAWQAIADQYSIPVTF